VKYRVWDYIYEILNGKGYGMRLSNPIRTRAIPEASLKMHPTFLTLNVIIDEKTEKPKTGKC